MSTSFLRLKQNQMKMKNETKMNKIKIWTYMLRPRVGLKGTWISHVEKSRHRGILNVKMKHKTKIKRNQNVCMPSSLRFTMHLSFGLIHTSLRFLCARESFKRPLNLREIKKVKTKMARARERDGRRRVAHHYQFSALHAQDAA